MNKFRSLTVHGHLLTSCNFSCDGSVDLGVDISNIIKLCECISFYIYKKVYVIIIYSHPYYMATYHIKKQSYNGYYVGECVEYPIILDAKTNAELDIQFAEAIEVYEKALKDKLIKLPQQHRPQVKMVQIEQ